MNKINTEIDILKELASIGAGNSASSLSTLVGSKIEVEMPKVAILKLENISVHFGYQEETSTAVVLKINHDLSGIFLMMMPSDLAYDLASLIKFNQLNLGQVESVGVLKELGNILCGTAINSLANFLGLNLSESIPDIATDMSKAIADSVVSELGEVSEEVLVFETNFVISKIDLKVLYMFDPRSTIKILEIAKKKI